MHETRAGWAQILLSMVGFILLVSVEDMPMMRSLTQTLPHLFFNLAFNLIQYSLPHLCAGSLKLRSPTFQCCLSKIVLKDP